jgi:hypothetical protein
MVESKQLVRELYKLLAKVKSHTLTSKLLAAWTQEYYWQLMEGEGNSDETPAAEFLRDVLADVTAQRECLLGNLHDEAGIEALSAAEFPPELIADWLLQVEQFLPTVDSGEPMPQLQ